MTLKRNHAIYFASVIFVGAAAAYFFVQWKSQGELGGGDSDVGGAGISSQPAQSGSDAQVIVQKENEMVAKNPSGQEGGSLPVLDIDSLNRLYAAGGSASELFDSIREAAGRGDGVAAFLLFDLSRRCAGIPRDDDDLEAQLAAKKKGAEENGLGIEALDQISRDYSFCAGLPTGNLSRDAAIELVRLAAESGVIEARREYIVQVLSDYTGLGEIVNDSARIVAEMQRASGYLSDNISAGDKISLLNLADLYSTDVAAVRDVPRAVALYRLHSRVSGVDNFGHFSALEQGLSSRERVLMLELEAYYAQLYGGG